MELISFYKNTQKNGLKDCHEQIKMFDDKCLWLSFSDPQVITGGGVKTANGKQALLKLFEQYNDTVRNLFLIEIAYLNEFADESNHICGFNMLITIQKEQSGEKSKFFNTLELHINDQNKVCKACNWMGFIQDDGLVNQYILGKT